MRDKPKAVSNAPGARRDRLVRRLSEAERKERQSDLLDEALQETFPASDPVSVVDVE